LNQGDNKRRNRSLTILRRTVQIFAFLLINYVIIEAIFAINLLSLDGLIKILPILNSPRNPISNGAGILEFIFYFLLEGFFVDGFALLEQFKTPVRQFLQIKRK